MTEDDLQKLKESYPLPDGMEDVECSLTDLQGVFNVSTNTLTDWHRTQGMPVKEEGGNGRAYVFQLSDVWAWYKDREARRNVEDRAKRDMLAKARLALFPDDEERTDVETLSHAERIKAYDAEQAWYKTNSFREAYCSRASVTELIDHLLATMRDTLEALPNRLETDAAATPQQVALTVTICDETLARLKAQIEASPALVAPSAQTAQPATGELPLN